MAEFLFALFTFGFGMFIGVVSAWIKLGGEPSKPKQKKIPKALESTSHSAKVLEARDILKKEEKLTSLHYTEVVQQLSENLPIGTVIKYNNGSFSLEKDSGEPLTEFAIRGEGASIDPRRRSISINDGEVVSIDVAFVVADEKKSLASFRKSPMEHLYR